MHVGKFGVADMHTLNVGDGPSSSNVSKQPHTTMYRLTTAVIMPHMLLGCVLLYRWW